MDQVGMHRISFCNIGFAMDFAVISFYLLIYLVLRMGTQAGEEMRAGGDVGAELWLV